MKKITLLSLVLLPFLGFSQTTYNVTFQVDMNQYNATSIGNVEVFGSFNNWAGGVTIMSDANSDGVYDVTVAMPAGAIEYLFFVDSNSMFEYNGEDFNSTQPFCTTGSNKSSTHDPVTAEINDSDGGGVGSGDGGGDRGNSDGLK